MNFSEFAKAGGAIELLRVGYDKLIEKAVELASEFVEQIKTTIEAGEGVKHLAQTTGLTTEAIQNLTTAAEFSGVATETMASSIGFLSRNMLAAKNGSADAQKAFHQLGVKTTDAKGKLRNADDVLRDISDKFAAMPDGAQKSALAMEAFGRGGRALIPLLNKGAEGIEKLSALAPNLTDEQIEASEQIIRAQKELAATTKALWQGAVGPLLPAISDLVKQFLAWRKANAEVLRQRLQAFLSGALAVIRSLGYALSAVTNAIGFMTEHWRGLLAIMSPVIVAFGIMEAASIAAAVKSAVAWAIAAAPLVLIAGLIAGIVAFFDDIQTYKKAISEGGTGKNTIFGKFKITIDEWLKPNANDPWWLKAIKQLVAYMEEALGIAKDLGLAGDKATGRINNGAGVGRAVGDVSVQRGALARLFGSAPKITHDQYGNPNVELGAIDRLFGTDVKYGPSSGAAATVNNTFHVTQLPGEDGEHFAQRVAEIARADRQSEYESSAAAVPAAF